MWNNAKKEGSVRNLALHVEPELTLMVPGPFPITHESQNSASQTVRGVNIWAVRGTNRRACVVIVCRVSRTVILGDGDKLDVVELRRPAFAGGKLERFQGERSNDGAFVMKSELNA